MKKKRGRRIAMLLAIMMLVMNLIVSPVWAGPVDVVIDETNFPDENFRKYVSKEFDKDNNGKLSDTEIARKKSIDVRDKDIANLKGIEYFTPLKWLYCDGNQLSTLDISKNTALQTLSCSKNQLTSLDVSKNPALEELRCYNNKLTNLDVSKNPALQTLKCNENQLTKLDVSKNTALQTLYCSLNQLSTLDISKNTALKELRCYNCQLTKLDISKNTALKELWCQENQLTELDVSQNTELQTLRCAENKLTKLDVSQNKALDTLSCTRNQLTILDVSQNKALSELTCIENQLTSLDLGHPNFTVGLDGRGQKYDVDIRTTDMKIPYAAFPGTFDINKATNIVGADYNFIVDITKPSTVTYEYDTDNYYESGSYTKNFNVTLNITYYVYIVTFDTNGGTEVKLQIIKEGEHATIPTAPTKDGYTFAGWYKDAGLTTPFDFATETINADITLYAKWTQNAPTSYTVTFNANGHGTAPASITVNKGAVATKPADPTDADYDFGGWYTEAECTNEFDFSQAVNADITLFAKWTEKTPPTPVTYTLTASVEGGHGSVTPTNATKNKDETVTLTFTPETGYELDEVKVNDVATSVSGNTLTLTMDGDKTVVVKYKATPTPPIVTPVTITFDKNGGTGTMADVTKNKGESFTLPACTFTPPAGKEFKAWQVDGTEKNVGDNIVLNGDKIIKAVWKDKGSVPPTPLTPPTPTPEPTPSPYPYPIPWIIYPSWYYAYETPEPKEEPVKIDRKIVLTIGSFVMDRELNGISTDIMMDVAPYIKEGRTMLPVRYVAEGLGFDVEWIESTRTVVLLDGTTKVEIPVDTDKIIVNGTVYTGDVKPEIKKGRTMLSIANIARALGLQDGKDIIWNDKSKTVTIYRTILVK